MKFPKYIQIEQEWNLMALIDRIKYDGYQDGSPWLIHKFPSEEFVLGSQLIVNLLPIPFAARSANACTSAISYVLPRESIG